MLIKYNKCVYCNSTNIIKLKKQTYRENFYTKAIRSDLNISKVTFNKIKMYQCNKCKIFQNNPWFNKDTTRKIYTNIYGQHNRSWENLLNFIKKYKTPNHGSLYKILKKNIKINNYAEYNSPFTGLMLNFLSNEKKFEKKIHKSFFSNIFNYLRARQVAGKSKKVKEISKKKTIVYKRKIDQFKKKYFKKTIVKKSLIIDNSPLCWGINDNFNSVNSKAYASELLDLNILNLNENNNNKFDLFGIFHTLDHTFEPKKLLNFALDSSRYVMIYCHVDPLINKQHLFSFTAEFLEYLNSEKIFTLNLTKKIKKNYTSPELYFLCSKKNNFKKFVD